MVTNRHLVFVLLLSYKFLQNVLLLLMLEFDFAWTWVTVVWLSPYLLPVASLLVELGVLDTFELLSAVCVAIFLLHLEQLLKLLGLLLVMVLLQFLATAVIRLRGEAIVVDVDPKELPLTVSVDH